MSESVPVSEEFREFLESRQREDETMAETLRRLVETRRADEDGSERSDLTGPHPSEVAGIISSETAEQMRERIEQSAERDAAVRRDRWEQLE